MWSEVIYCYTSSNLNIVLRGKVISQIPKLDSSFISEQCNFVGYICAPAVTAPQPLEVNRLSAFWSDDIESYGSYGDVMEK